VRTTSVDRKGGGGGLPASLEWGKGVVRGGKLRRVAPRLCAKAGEKKDEGAGQAP
jgi:hypothetical protein